MCVCTVKEGYFFDKKYQICIKCPSGLAWDSDKRHCVKLDCPEGFTLNAHSECVISDENREKNYQ